MTTALFGIKVALINSQSVFLRKPLPRPMEFLTALRLDASVFLEPNRSCQVIIPLKSTT